MPSNASTRTRVGGTWACQPAACARFPPLREVGSLPEEHVMFKQGNLTFILWPTAPTTNTTAVPTRGIREYLVFPPTPHRSFVLVSVNALNIHHHHHSPKLVVCRHQKKMSHWKIACRTRWRQSISFLSFFPFACANDRSAFAGSGG